MHALAHLTSVLVAAVLARVRQQSAEETRLLSGLQGEKEVQQRAQHVQAAVAYHLLTSYYEREPAAMNWLSKLEGALFQAGGMQPGSAGPEPPGQVQSSEQAIAAHIAGPWCCSAACHWCCQGRKLRCLACTACSGLEAVPAYARHAACHRVGRGL